MQTFDVIGAELQQIHSSYGLLGKVLDTVTENDFACVLDSKGTLHAAASCLKFKF